MTHLYQIYNRTPRNYSVLKLESPDVRAFVSAGDDGGFNGEAVPWCEDRSEIRTKAFLFRRDATSADDGVGDYYLFQDEDGRICWTLYNVAEPTYEGRHVGPYIDEAFGNPVFARIDDDGLQTFGPLFAPE